VKDKTPMDLSDQPPMHDAVKREGAADFYFAINATWRFVLSRFGVHGLRRYWTELGTLYFAPVSESWKQGGLSAVARYWSEFFAVEPGAEVDICESTDVVTLNIRACPAIKHLREHGREILACFCQHCYFLSEAVALPAGLTVRVKGGNGVCQQRFLRRDNGEPAQDLEAIREATTC
jgi:hypothetical protein